MEPSLRKAYYVYFGQKNRCYNKNNIYYKWYGGRGIQVKYSTREFLGWWKNQPVSQFKKPSCGRINNDGHYEFGNIRIEELSDNIKERNKRRGNPGKRHRKVRAYFFNRELDFNSKLEAAKFFNVSEKTVFNHCEKKTKCPFKFGPRHKIKPRFQWI